MDKAKKLSASLAKRAEQGKQNGPAFVEDLSRLRKYLEKQRAAGKQLRGGKHMKILSPLIAALPKNQRALGLHVSAEHAATRAAVDESVSTHTEKLQALLQG